MDILIVFGIYELWSFGVVVIVVAIVVRILRRFLGFAVVVLIFLGFKLSFNYAFTTVKFVQDLYSTVGFLLPSKLF